MDETPVLPDDDPKWPYKGTRAQIKAAEEHLRAAAEVFPKKSREWRSANMHLTRLKMRKAGHRRARSKVIADKEYKLRLVAERGKEITARAEKAVETLYDLAANGRSAVLMRRIVHMTELYGPDIIEERLKNGDLGTKWKTLQECLEVVKASYKTEADKEPKKATGPRRVVVSWPNEGAKS